MRKHLAHGVKLILFILGLGCSPAAMAQEASGGPFWMQQTTRLAGYAISYSGEEEESLASKKGFGGEVITERGSRNFSILGKAALEYSKSEASFDDGGTTRSLDYELLMAELHLGFKVGLFPTKHFAPYLAATGVVGLANLAFTGSPTLTELSKAQTSTAFGYTVSAGVELRFAREGAGKFVLFAEVQSRDSQADLAGKSSFQLDGLKLVGGIGW